VNKIICQAVLGCYEEFHNCWVPCHSDNGEPKNWVKESTKEKHQTTQPTKPVQNKHLKTTKNQPLKTPNTCLWWWCKATGDRHRQVPWIWETTGCLFDFGLHCQVGFRARATREVCRFRKRRRGCSFKRQALEMPLEFGVSVLTNWWGSDISKGSRCTDSNVYIYIYALHYICVHVCLSIAQLQLVESSSHHNWIISASMWQSDTYFGGSQFQLAAAASHHLSAGCSRIDQIHKEIGYNDPI